VKDKEGKGNGEEEKASHLRRAFPFLCPCPFTFLPSRIDHSRAKVSTFKSCPSVLILIVPLRPVRRTRAPTARQRSRTFLSGWPKGDAWPTELTESVVRVAAKRASVEEVHRFLLGEIFAQYV
jgi:hypothetical protein